MSFIRSISGLRATLGDDLTPALVASYSTAFATLQPDGPIVVGHDGRPSGAWIIDIVCGSLRACGRTVQIAGMVPTPTVQLLVEKSNAAGGIVVTASHNPAEWNGLKFLDHTGVFLDASGNTLLWEIVDSHQTRGLSKLQQNGSTEIVNGVDVHLKSVLDKIVPPPSAVAGSLGTVVVDAVNSSGSVIIPSLLRKFGFDVVELFCDSTGVFPHTPEPVTENLSQLMSAVVEHSAVMGVAIDPDADRLVLIDNNGHAIGEECTVALAALAAFTLGERGSVVVNYSTSRMIDFVAQQFNSVVHRSAVGEINVVKKMQEVGAMIGGEGSGGVIYPALHFGRDSVVGLALICSLLTHTENNKSAMNLSELRNSLPSYSMVKSKFALKPHQGVQSILELCCKRFVDADTSTVDGFYASWPGKWIHIRASNTEPIIRVIVEAETDTAAQELLATVKDLVEG